MNHSVYRPVCVPYVSRTMLVTLFLLFLGGWNTQAWGWAGAKVYVYSNPSNGGYVYVNTSNSGPSSYSKTSDDASQSDKWATFSSPSFDFYLFASAKSGSGYTFKGWATSDNTNTVESTTRTSYKVNKKGYVGVSYTEYKYYAIFARLASTTANKTTFNFGDVIVGDESGAQTLTINHAHAKTVTLSKTGDNPNDFELSESSFSSVAEDSKSITIKFKPSSNGLRTCTLTVSSNNGLSSLTYYLKGTGYSKQSFTWDDGDENHPLESGVTTLSAGDVLRATCQSGQVVSYSNYNTSYFTAGTDASGNPILTVRDDISGTINGLSVTANVAKDNTNYNAANSDVFTLNVTNLTPQEIEWMDDISDLSNENMPYTITLSAVAKNSKTGAASGLPVTYSMASNSSLSLSGNVLTVRALGGPIAITASVSGNENYAPASVTKYATVINMTDPCGTVDNHSNGQFNQGGVHDIYPTLPVSVTFTAKRESSWLLKDLVITQYKANGNVYSTTTKSNDDISTSGTQFTIDSDPSVTKIRFAAKSSARYTYYITGITTKRQTGSSVSDKSLSYSVTKGQSLGKDVTITYSNIPVFLSFKSDEDAHVSSGKSLWSLSTAHFGGCGKKGSQTVRVTFMSNAKGNFSDKLYIRNNVGDLLHTIDLTASVTAQNQFLNTWNIKDVYSTTDKITLSASTLAGHTDFTFAAEESTPQDIVSISNGVMTFSASGTATIKATLPEIGVYETFSTTHDITINKVTPNIAENPSVATIKYKDSFANGLFSGGKATVTLRGVENTEVDGTFGWTNAGNVADGQGSHNYSVTFTPENGNMYAPKVFTLPVTVSRANGGIVMKDGKKVKVHVAGLNDASNEWKIDLDTIIQSKITDAVANRAGGVTYEVISANKANASIDGNNIFSATERGTYTLRATQAQTDYYTLATDEFDIVVEKVVPTFRGTDNYSMKVGAEQPNAFSFEDVETLVPHITHHINAINNGDGQVIEYDAANNKIIAHNAGTAEIYFTQEENGTNAGGTSAVFHYTVTKHEPKFTWNKNNKEYYYESTIANIFETSNSATDTTVVSNNPTAAYVENNTLHILNVEENTTFSIHQAENYYWAAKDTSITITPKVTDNHVTFTIDGNNRNYMVSVNDGENVVWDNNGYKMGDGTWVYSQAPETYIIISFTGTPDRLTFTKTLDKVAVFNQYPADDECLFEVYESATNGNWGSPIWSYNQQEASRDVTDVPPLNPTTRYLKLRYHGTVYGHFNNIKVTELKRFDADKETVDFGLQGAAYGVQEMQLNFTHANAGRTTNMEIVGPDAAYFSVEPNVLPETGRDITGTVNFHVFFDNGSDRRDTNPYNAELVFTDNLGHEEHVALTGVREGLSLPTFTFNPNNLPYYYGSTIANVAVSTNTDYTNCPLSYQTSDSDIAYVDSTGLHIGNKQGEVTITVHQGGGGDFREWSQGFTFTPRERPSLHTPFVVTSSVFNNAGKSGSNCSWNNDKNRVELGNSVLGGFNWDSKSFTLVFDGMPDSLSFQYACSASGTTGVAVWQVKESADGSNWTQVWIDGAHSDAWKTMHASLKESTRYLQFIYSANFAGYLKDIKVTGIEGYAFLRAGEGQYLSRGADWSTRAIVDEYGVACRITRTTNDNTNYKTRLQFVDSEQYMFEDGDAIYTDHSGRTPIYWNIVENAGTVTIQSANNTSHNGHYVTVNEDGVLAFTSDAAQATHWYKDGAAQYQNYITQKLDQQATAAAQYDFEGLKTLAAVRKELNENEYDFNVIDVPAVAEYIEQKGDYRNSVGVIQNNYEYVAEDLIPGFYKLTVQGFNRMGSQKAAYTMFANNMESSLAYIYANDVKYPMMSLLNVSGRRSVASPTGTDYYYPDGYFYADDKEAALVSFANEKAYLNDVYVYVNADEGKETGTLRYGIRNTSYIDGAWLIYGNIKLYRLARAEYVFNPENNDKKWGESDNWNREDGKTPTDQSVVVVKKDAEISGNAAVYSLTIEENVTVTVKNGATLTIGEQNSYPRTKYGNLHIENGGKVILTTGKLIVNDFVLDAELADLEHSGRSGQVHNINQLVVNGDAYFDLALDPSGKCSPGWYDFTVPFPVDAVNGVTRFRNSDHQEYSIRNEVNYAIMDFSESRRVETGYGWKKYHSVMQPGQCYTITIDSYDNIYRFKKTATGSLNLSSTTLMAYSDVENENKGWNCLGNGTLEYANLSVEGIEIEKVHIYSHTTNSYTAVPIDEYTYVVGSAYMIHTPSEGKKITYTHEGGTRTLRAPRRSSSETEFMLSLSQEGANYSYDRLYVSADEEATYYYEAGRELMKFAAPTDSKVAQVWANAYGMKLCDIEMPLVNEEAAVVLSFYAPKAGSYTFAIDRMPEDEAVLYLTYNGSDIWNLTESPYTLDLSKGTTEGYGLRIQSRNAPQITTGVDEIDGEKEGNRKVLIGNDIYIITKEGAIFNATGKKVK